MLLLLALALAPPPPADSAADSNTHFHATRRTTAPAARIWAIWTDVPRWPTWDAVLRQATLSGPFAVGTRGRLRPDFGPAARFTLMALEPGRSYTFRSRLPLGALYVKRQLTRAGSQTEFTHEVWCTGLSKPLFGRVLGRRYRALLPGVLAAIQQQAEQP